MEIEIATAGTLARGTWAEELHSVSRKCWKRGGYHDDHTHFDTPGAAQIAGVVAQELRDQKIGLAAYLLLYEGRGTCARAKSAMEALGE